MTMSADSRLADGKIHAQRIPGTNGWRAAVNYQGTVVTCDHRHATAPAARQCLDVATKAKALRDAAQEERTIVSIDCRPAAGNGGWRWVEFSDGTGTHMSVAEVEAIDPSPETAIMLADDAHLLRTFAHLTHLMAAALERKDYATRTDLRAQRDLVQAEALRRMSRTA